VIVIGIAGVVAVLVSVLAMGAGFRHTLADTGRADRVIILRGGSDAELNSNLTRTDVDTISNAPGLAKDAGGSLHHRPAWRLLSGAAGRKAAGGGGFARGLSIRSGRAALLPSCFFAR
jgi:hypothetical protein